MQAKEAIQAAKQYVAEVFEDEGVFNIGLEEIRLGEAEPIWEVTIGFSREWDIPKVGALSGMVGTPTAQRVYKIVEIADETGEVLGVKNYPLAA